MPTYLLHIDPLPRGPIQFNLDMLLTELASLHHDWKELGAAMSFSEDLLDEIYTNNETDEGCFRDLLEYYMKKRDKKHSWAEIVSILKEIDVGDLADKLKDVYVCPCKIYCFKLALLLTLYYTLVCRY